MKRLIFTIFLNGIFLWLPAQECPVVPLPQNVQKQDGTFILSNNTVIIIQDDDISPIAHMLQEEVLKIAKIALPVLDKYEKYQLPIILKHDKSSLNEDAYKLLITNKEIVISGKGNRALHNGVNSLLQLISSKLAYASKTKVEKTISIDCWIINDEPRYEWRGLMLDESRHFFGKDQVKKVLRWMAFYKLNKFHWHLTDAQGWRLEIKNYPKLALIGGIGKRGDENAPATFYTQEDIREIVAYAQERFITIIPEIDMPGHASAANRAYPEFSGGGSKKFREFTFNPGKEGTYDYLTQILREVDALFPSQMIHIGGDEVHYGNTQWNTNIDVLNLMQKESLKDLKSVEHYFFNRMADSVLKLNNKVLAWDEAVGADISVKKSIVFWWRHDKVDVLNSAMEKGYNVVLCPRLPFYLDYSQDRTHIHGPFEARKINPSEAIYKFLPEKLSPELNKKQIMGVQANLWTERVETIQRLEFMLFPRMAALAETAWTEEKNKDYEVFKKRMQIHTAIYRLNNIYHYDLNMPAKNGEPIN